MAQNPLIGSRISLISKKNIRYEGKLYSINEQDATVALKNVKSYGTEGREKSDSKATFVPKQDAIHPYLVFRGSDIKDLHVHEQVAEPVQQQKQSTLPQQKRNTPNKKEEKTTPKKNITSSTTDVEKQSYTPSKAPTKVQQKGKELGGGGTAGRGSNQYEGTRTNNNRNYPVRKHHHTGRGGNSRRNTTPQHQVGTGASLLSRKARGQTNTNNLFPTTPDFDIQSHLANFDKEDAEEEPECYDKDNSFFDSISCDAIDRQQGKDNRLRGSHERCLNTETFGAVALNGGNRRYNHHRRGGRGRGRGNGRGRGGRGSYNNNRRGRGGRGSARNNNNRYNSHDHPRTPTTATTTRVVEAS